MASWWFSALYILFFVGCAIAGSPYRFFTWNITWGTISPLGVPQKAILINGMFPGPEIVSVTNDNIIVNVINNLDEYFLLTWNGIQQRKNSWEDGVMGTNCRIPPGKNFTYKMQVKDQIGSFFYFPSTYYHRTAGAFGGFSINSRPLIPVPFPPPARDITLLIGDWYKTNHSILRRRLDRGRALWNPDGVLINGRTNHSITVEQGKTYRLRISNVGVASSLNFRIQGHTLLLVEVEGTHCEQTHYDSLDVHVGQSLSVLVTADQSPKDYLMVVSTRFTDYQLNGTAILHYRGAAPGSVQGPFPAAPPEGIEWSLNQAKSIRTNLTASAARPNPQGSYHYGGINITRTIVLENSLVHIHGKRRFVVNNVSMVLKATPLKLADYFNITGVFTLGSIPDSPRNQPPRMVASVLDGTYRNFIEIVFQNNEKTIQSWHLDGYSFFVVGMGAGQWTNNSRRYYNLFDAISRPTTQVYPKHWTAILLSLDNAGMWNLRSAIWERQYLGQQLYMRVKSPVRSTRDEYEIPSNALLCGKAKRFRAIPPP